MKQYLLSVHYVEGQEPPHRHSLGGERAELGEFVASLDAELPGSRYK
jgi:hypothetical protein